MARKVSYGVQVNGEHIAIFSTEAEADERAQQERAQLGRFEREGWIRDAAAFRVNVIRLVGRVW